MLRVTQSSEGENGPILKLEGKLIQPWVDEVSSLLNEGKLSAGSRLDLSSLTFVDEAGANLLLRLLGQGFQIETSSPYVAEILQLRRDQNY
jgi:anti-anti-sigma regulatory factor